MTEVELDLRVDAAWAQIPGGRSEQQDTALVTRWDNGFHLFVLADGMGGHVGGGHASRLVAEGMRDGFIQAQGADNPARLIAGLKTANEAVDAFRDAHPEQDGMGSTLVAATFDGQSLEWLSIGDSPLWLLRKGTLRRLNAIHSVGARLDQQAAAGEISLAEARDHRNRAQLLEAVMGNDIHLVDRPNAPLPLAPGDCIVLASDGIETLSLSVLARLLDEADLTAADRINGVLAAINEQQRPHQDNATIVMACLSAQPAANETGDTRP
ncbi:MULTISPECIES: PP2C family serine/threonine-protein phosphatase [unclassified Thioalkalivibrio]|uniref:PP2C family protein-serine/threonine phosphatase n=1 Tax=unclassified Thioalkalivibrio TaxID=2621013 RepID=UPI00037E4B80|nr:MULTISPECIES: protein phosphatase 2C domain-containing protein [unclassified Thioalkalivibrio]